MTKLQNTLRITLSLALLLSILGNVWLTAHRFERGLPAVVTALTNTAGSSKATLTQLLPSSVPLAAPAPDGTPPAIRPLNPELANHHDVLVRLKAEGFDKTVANYIVIAVYTGKSDGSVSGDFNREFDELFGPSEADARNRESNRRLVYGDLAPEKIDAIEKLRTATIAEYEVLPREQSSQTSPQEMLAERVRDLLTPEETEDFLTFNSPLAKAVQHTIRSIATSEDEYRQLLAVGPGHILSRTRDRDSPEVKGVARKYQEILGVERFLMIANQFSGNAASIDGVYRDAGLPADARADLFQRALDAESGPSTREGLPTTEHATSIYLDLTTGAGLSATQQAAFDQTTLGRRLKQAMSQ